MLTQLSETRRWTEHNISFPTNTIKLPNLRNSFLYTTAAMTVPYEK